MERLELKISEGKMDGGGKDESEQKNRSREIVVGCGSSGGGSVTGYSGSGSRVLNRRCFESSFGLEDEAKSCTECGKRFTSDKALYGHMRCHPEREWRGINPPAMRSISPSTPKVEEPPMASNLSVVVSFGDHEAAACLLMLAKGACGGPTADDQPGRGPVVSAVSPNGDDGGEGDGNSNIRMTMLLSGHQCSICFKVFSSGRALGGHKRCHWEKTDQQLQQQQQQAPLTDRQLPNASFHLDLNSAPASVEQEPSSNYISSSSLNLESSLRM